MTPIAASPERKSSPLKGILGYGLGLLILGFLFHFFKSSASKLSAAAVPVTASSVAIALTAGLAASVLSAWSWTWTLRVLGARCSFRAASHVWYNSMVARYVPGTVPGIAYRIYLTTDVGVSRLVAAAATVMDWVCWLVSALLACLITLPWWSESLSRGLLNRWQWIGVALSLPIGLLLLHPRSIGFLLRKASRRAGAEAIPEMTYRQTLSLLPVYLVKWPFYGLSLAIFLPAAAGTNSLAAAAAHLPCATGAFSLGWILGFISPVSPGGLGVREGVIVGILHAVSSVSILLEAAILSRLTTTAAEVICWIWAILDRKMRAGSSPHPPALEH